MNAHHLLSIAVILPILFTGFISAASGDETASVRGTVIPADVLARVEAVADGRTIAWANADTRTGNFILEGIPSGTYKILITPHTEGFKNKVLDHIPVGEGESVDLGEIELERIKE
jgi:hypothetical protein